MQWLSFIGVCVLFAGPVSDVFAGTVGDDYVIVSLVPESDAYYAAAKELERLRGGRIVAAEVDALDKLLDDLRLAPPRYLAVVLRPEMLDENFARKFLVLATKVDDDPFVDFAYGFITGDSAETAVLLAGASTRVGQRRRPDVAMVGVAGTALSESMSSTQQLPLRKGSLTQAMHLLSGGDAANGSSGDDLGAARDERFIREVMPKLAGHSILLFAGHGYPRQVVGGPTYRHLAGQRYDGAVALNIACYTGVTARWFDSDWRSMKVRSKRVPAEESFCLNMLETGVAGYVAYVSARPAGPAMLGDALTLATAGESIGELMRDSANSVVLAHLQQGYDALHVVELEEGAPIEQQRKVRDVLIAMSTGGALFGDPAHVPFGRLPGAHPIKVKVDRKADLLEARVEVAGPLYHFFCSDQVVMWDEGKPSLRLEARVPLGDRYATDVRLTSNSLGDVPHRLTAAIEDHRGKRFLHVKGSFAQPEMTRLMQFAGDGVSGTFEITTSGEPQKAVVVRGGETD